MEHAKAVGAFEDLISDEPVPSSQERKWKTIISRIFKRYNGRRLGDYTFSLEGQGHSRKYQFKHKNVGRRLPTELEE